MINLLPDSHKGEIRAARTNVLLVRYIAILSAAIIVLGGIIIAAYVVLDAKETLALSLVETNKAKTAPYDSTRQEAEALRTSLSDAKTFESASQLKEKVAANTEVFSDVKLVSLESAAAAGNTGEYPVRVSISAVINKAALQ